ncbi:hypothetical protein CMQ_4200 [Grosmannia clavigera kw1407]|uniref:Mitochondrial fission process protein 1 n=1 Tax=Grosmannia clavigera (strain kw1407 / UAMH 11150) TaxID=655863 RepID=F0X8G6_GROCL|nr:uncharacterized protein CMQ_4200 [Grosmannia clavigera kw1407]EFX06131.1 hypothetical protein CMQ_4200 [Grosmannia clavigera kw1407]
MFWSKGPSKSPDDKPGDGKTTTETELFSRSKDRPVKGEAGFSEEKLPDSKKLPRSLQKIVDKEEHDDNFYDEVMSGYASQSTDSNVRYAAYAARLRTILLSAHRYVAYTSDVGESFRPVAHPGLVRGAYAVSWAYILGDVGYEGYKAYWQNQRQLHPELRLTERQSKLARVEAEPKTAVEADATAIVPQAVPALQDYRTVMAQRALFQSIASMGLPAFTIHSVVRYAGRALKGVKNVTVRTWAPIGLGLAVVPLLPSMFDEPVENAVEWVFHKSFATLGGHDAVGNAPSTGREKSLSDKPKEKEL